MTSRRSASPGRPTRARSPRSCARRCSSSAHASTTPVQTASAAIHIAHNPRVLRAPARAEGFTQLILGATLPGVPLYRAFGFEEIERFELTMPDGVTIEAVAMQRAVRP